jgi:hypothetical protein
LPPHLQDRNFPPRLQDRNLPPRLQQAPFRGMYIRTSDDRRNSHVSSKLPNTWQRVTDKSSSKKSYRTTHDQLPIPVTNRYDALCNADNSLRHRGPPNEQKK